MKVSSNLNYKKHVFVCVNQRDSGKVCCADVNGMDVFNNLKQWVISTGLTSSVWVTKSGCLGFCNNTGATVVVYPEKKWFFEVKIDDLNKIKTELVQ